MKKFIKGSYFAIVMAFIYIPVVVMILFSFNSGSTTFSWIGFSSKWYGEFLHNSPFIKSIITSLFVAVVSTVISLIIGVTAAIGLSKTKSVTQKSWMSVANIPLINADVVTAVSLMIVFLLSGIKFGIVTLLMAHISFNVPYVLITVMPRLRKIDRSIVEAGMDLGAKSSQVLFRVILPLLKPAIIAAAAIAFAMSFDDFIISYFTGGSQTNVSAFIYAAKKIRPYIFVFGTLMVVIIALAVIGWNAVSIYRQQKANKVERIKNDLYKTKQLSKLQKELEYLQWMGATSSKVGYSPKLHLWIRYWYLKIRIKIASAWNYDKKISRLEWKQYKLKSKISQEKRYYSRRDNAQKRLTKLLAQLNKASDVKKAAKLTLQIEKVQARLDFLNEEIKWVEDRDQLVAKRVKKIKKDLRDLNWDLAHEIEPSKKTLAWYHKKIKTLEALKIEIEEGKNHYKLRMVVESLKEIQALRYDQILMLNEKLNQLRDQVVIKKSITPKLDQKILTTNNEIQLAQLMVIKGGIEQKFQTKILHSMNRKNQQIAQLKTKIQKAKIKVSPVFDDDEAVHIKGFLARSWKVILVSLLGIAAFSGLTVAYVMNNIYDLVIGNWGEYIDPVLIAEFEKEYHVKVNYQEYDSNETLYNKLYTFSYDLMVPSDYMVQRLAQEDQLLELDYTKINVNAPWKTLANDEDETKVNLVQRLTDSLLEFKFDVKSPDGTVKVDQNLLDYSIPYFWGDLVVVVNPTEKNKQFLTDHQIEFDADTGQINQSQLSWNLLWDAAKEGKNVALNNDPKNLFALAAEKIYQKVNLKLPSEVDSLKSEVKNLIMPRNVSLNGDDLMTKVSQGLFDFAMMYSGDAVYANQVYNGEDAGDSTNIGNTKFLFGRPNQKEGDLFQTTNVFSDNIVVSKRSSNPDLAYKFINFILTHAAEISSYVGTATPVQEAMDELTGADGDFEKYKMLYQPTLMDSSYQTNNGEDYILAFKYHEGTDDYLVNAFNEIVAGKIG